MVPIRLQALCHSPSQLVMSVDYLLLVRGIDSSKMWWQTVCTVFLLQKGLLPLSTYVQNKVLKLFLWDHRPYLRDWPAHRISLNPLFMSPLCL